MARFGWCLDGLHDRCRGSVPSGVVTCDCPCHDATDVTELPLLLDL